MSEETKKYVWSQINVNFAINLVLNGVLAWLLNSSKEVIPMADILFDLTVTTLLIVFIVCVLSCAGTSKAIADGKLVSNGWQPSLGIIKRWSSIRNLWRSVLLAILMTLVLIPLLYGIFSLLGIAGISVIGYMIFKAIFAGVIAGGAAWLSNLGTLAGPSVKLEASAA